MNYQIRRKKGRPKAAESKPNGLQKPLTVSKELAAVIEAGTLPRLGAKSPAKSGPHQSGQPAEPREPPRNFGGRQAPKGVWQGQGDHV